jgi:hypothetical protein
MLQMTNISPALRVGRNIIKQGPKIRVSKSSGVQLSLGLNISVSDPHSFNPDPDPA